MILNLNNGDVYSALGTARRTGLLAPAMLEAVDAMTSAADAGESWPSTLKNTLDGMDGWGMLKSAQSVLNNATPSTALTAFKSASNDIGELCSRIEGSTRTQIYSDAAHACVLNKVAWLAMPTSRTSPYVGRYLRRMKSPKWHGPWTSEGWGIYVLRGMTSSGPPAYEVTMTRGGDLNLISGYSDGGGVSADPFGSVAPTTFKDVAIKEIATVSNQIFATTQLQVTLSGTLPQNFFKSVQCTAIPYAVSTQSATHSQQSGYTYWRWEARSMFPTSGSEVVAFRQ